MKVGDTLIWRKIPFLDTQPQSRVSAYETELKEESAARLAAEIRATAAETELKILNERHHRTKNATRRKNDLVATCVRQA